jgi:hypothetical protein
MDDLHARKIAEDFIATRNSKFRYEFIGVVRSARHPSEANVNFDASGPDGEKFDGPVVVIVDEANETAKFFE